MKKKILVMVIVVMLMTACGFLEAEEETLAESQPGEMETGSGANGGGVSDQIDALMADYSDGPGGVVMVIQNGEVVFQNGYGLADVENTVPVDTDTVFHLGSVGKQFTAMGVMILVEQGLVDFDEPIGTYLPELDWMDEGVTIRRLLNHTSGIMGYDDSDDLYAALIDSAEMPTNDDLVQVLAENEDMLSEPGTEFNYSNTGYDILGAMIERVSGQKYPVFMQAYIFGPLGMIDTFAVPNSERLENDRVAQSYSTDGVYEPDQLDNLNGSGSIYSTLGDMYLYDQVLYTEELVSQETLTDAFTSGVLNNGEETGYGFGFDIAEYSGEAYVGHSGAWLGFESYYLRFSDLNISVVILLNFDYSHNEGAEGIAFAVADLFLK